MEPKEGKLLDRLLGLQANLSLDLALPLPGCLTLHSGGIDNNQAYETMAKWEDNCEHTQQNAWHRVASSILASVLIPCMQLLWLLEQIPTHLLGFKPQEFLLLQFWGQTSEMGVLVRPCSLQRLLGRNVPHLLQFLVVLGFLGLWPHCSHLCLVAFFPVYVSLSLFSPSIWTPVIGFKAHQNDYLDFPW